MPQIHYDILIIFIKTFHHQFKENEGGHLTYFFWPKSGVEVTIFSRFDDSILYSE